MTSNIRSTFKLSHISFALIFTSIIFIINNALILDQTARWFSTGDDLDITGLIAFYLFGYGFFLAFFILLAHRWMVKVSASLYILFCTASTYFIDKYQITVDHSMVRNLLHTDPSEANSFLSLQMLPYALFLALIPLVLLFHTRISFHKPIRHLVHTTLIFVLALTLSISMLYLKYDTIHRAVNLSDKYILFKLVPVNVIHSIYSLTEKALKPYFKKDKQTVVIKGEVTKKNDIIVILAIGETSRQKSFSLYGYDQKNTNPLLSQYSDIYTLNGHARLGSTLLALPEILAKDDIKLATVTSSLGVNTSCYVHYSLYDNCEAVGEIKVSNCKHNGKCYDEDVLPLLKNNLDSYTSGQRLVILHLGGGSHGPRYNHRYPEEFQLFNPQCLDADVINQCSKEELYNSFDNTILYVDYVLDEIIKTLEASKLPYIFIYLSDHGESLLEEDRLFHGMPPGIALPPEQAEIPLLVKSSLPIFIMPRKQYNQPDVYDTVLDLLSIETRTLNKERVFIKQKTHHE